MRAEVEHFENLEIDFQEETNTSTKDFEFAKLMYLNYY
jgi:hypothetical protein